MSGRKCYFRVIIHYSFPALKYNTLDFKITLTVVKSSNPKYRLWFGYGFRGESTDLYLTEKL